MRVSVRYWIVCILRIFVRVHNHFYIYYLLMSYCLIVLIGTCNPISVSVTTLRQSSVYCLNACLIAFICLWVEPCSFERKVLSRIILSITFLSTRHTKTPTIKVGVIRVAKLLVCNDMVLNFFHVVELGFRYCIVRKNFVNRLNFSQRYLFGLRIYERVVYASLVNLLLGAYLLS